MTPSPASDRSWQTGSDQRVEIARIGHRPAHGLGVVDGAQAVAERHRAGFAKKSDLGDLRASQSFGQRGRGKNPDLGVVAGAAQDEVDHCRIVHWRICVGTDDDARHSASRGRRARARDGLAVLGPGLANIGAHVDKARRDDVAATVDDARSFKKLVSGYRRPDGRNQAVLSQQAAPRLNLALWVDETRVDKGDGR